MTKENWNSGLVWLAVVWGAILIAWCLIGCKTTERVVTVPEVHEQHHWHTDSVHVKDSTVVERETVVMQLDSAAMAKYGIQLKAAERAWLVKTSELERMMREMAQMKGDTIHMRDSIAVPYPVEVEKRVVAPLSWWQRVRMRCGEALLVGLAFFIFVKIRALR